MKPWECPQDKRRLYWQEIIIHIKNIGENWQKKKKEEKMQRKLDKKNAQPKDGAEQVSNGDAIIE